GVRLPAYPRCGVQMATAQLSASVGAQSFMVPVAVMRGVVAALRGSRSLAAVVRGGAWLH
ncbi:unnamed protein product, partial [Urochloa humidicola]